MKIARFLDPEQRIRYGTPIDAHTAEVRAGDLYAGLEPTGEQIEVRKWLAPLVPVNIFCIGLNYRDHAAETGADPPRAPGDLRSPPPASPTRGIPCCSRRAACKGQRWTTRLSWPW